MPKNISNKRYLKLEEKYNACKKELDNIKKTNLYFYASKMPSFIKTWLFSEKYDTNILQITTENIDIEKGKIAFIVNTISYENNLEKLIDNIRNSMYINYEVILLCINEEECKKYLEIDQRIKILIFPDLKDINNITKNIDYIYNISNCEYFVYMNNFYIYNKLNIKKQVMHLNKGVDLNIIKSKLNDISYLVCCKKQCEKSIFNKLKMKNIIDLKENLEYRNIKINLV